MMAAKIDTDVKLPKAVRDAAARSDTIHQQAYNTGAGEGEGGDNQQQPTPAVEQEQAAQPDQQAQQPVKAQDQVQKPTLPAPTQEDWQHRYNSANGRVQHLTQENNRLSNENANLRNRMLSLESRLNELERQKHTAPKAQDNGTDPLAGVVSPDEIKEYGPDFFNLVTKVARAAAKPVVDDTVSNLKSEITKEITPLKSQVQSAGTAARTIAEERFYSQIAAAVPDWRELNRHPKFHNWLGLTDELSGVTRQKLLDDAVGRMDAARVLSFFTSFLRSEGITAPQGGNPAGNGKVSLEQLAAPGKANTGSGASPKNAPEKQIITRADIRQFYSDVQKGKYTPDQIKAAEVELQLAAQEGRIRD